MMILLAGKGNELFNLVWSIDLADRSFKLMLLNPQSVISNLYLHLRYEIAMFANIKHDNKAIPYDLIKNKSYTYEIAMFAKH
jgi:hypothetical protein